MGSAQRGALCLTDEVALSYLLKARREGKVVVDVEYNNTQDCYEEALKACNEGIYVYLAPNVQLDEPSKYCKAHVPSSALFSLWIIGALSRRPKFYAHRRQSSGVRA